jgi:hypothetical protein
MQNPPTSDSYQFLTRTLDNEPGISTLAEQFIVREFSSHFTRYYSGEVFTQATELQRSVQSGTMGRTLDALRKHFRNVYSMKTPKTSRGEPRAGRARKADALGVSGDGSVIQLLEVTTVGCRKETLQEIESKLEILKGPVTKYWTLRNIERDGTSRGHLDCYASPWRPPPEQIIPLPTSSTSRVDWICYKPTFRQPGGPNGLILYEIHSIHMDRQLVPEGAPRAVLERLKSAYRQANRPRASQLIGWGRAYLAKHPSDKAVLLGMGAGLIAVIVILLLGAPATLAALAEGGAAITEASLFVSALRAM